MKKFIPNALTCLNLFCGCIAVIFVLNGNFITCAFFVFLGIFFDFFDGLAARKLNLESELGLQLDSLADMVTSGLVPGLVMYKLFQLAGPLWQETTSGVNFNGSIEFENLNIQPFIILPFFGLLITLASAYRLAKFNIDEEQKTFFKGLPTPANALLILSLPLIIEFQNNTILSIIILNKWFLIMFTILSSYLLNSNIKLFALKFKNYSLKDNAIRYIFIMSCIVLIIALKFVAVLVIILLYIIMSVIDNLNSK